MDAVFRGRAARVAGKLGMDSRDVADAVRAYFGAMAAEAGKMPLDSPGRIYSKERLDAMGCISNVPHIGRIGPSYGKYLKWRAAEAGGLELVDRRVAAEISREETVDELARRALSGERIGAGRISSRLPAGRYRKIWLIGEDGRRVARQLIVKNGK